MADIDRGIDAAERSPLLRSGKSSRAQSPAINAEGDDVSYREVQDIAYNVSTQDDDLLPNWKVAMNIIKGSIGTGILGLPKAFSYAGVVVGPVVLGLMGIVSLHNMHLLVLCSRMITDSNRSGLDYGQLAQLVFGKHGGKWGKLASRTINAFLCVVQFGFCCVYVVFVSDNLYKLTNKTFSVRIWSLIILPFLILFACIRKLSVIAYLSFVSVILSLYGLTGVFVYLFENLKSPTIYPAFTNISSFALFFGEAVFAFEGIGVILPVEKKAKSKKDFVWVMYTSMIFVIVLYFALGLFGYISCGDTCKGSITLNLPDEPVYKSLQISYLVSIFFTYFIQFYVPIAFIMPFIRSRMSEARASLAEYALRTTIVLITCGLAIAFTNLTDLISLVGSVAGSAVLIVFPALLHTVCIWEDGHRISTKLAIIKNSIIMIIGVVGAVIGTYESARNIVANYGKSDV